MSILLPKAPGLRTAKPRLLDFGGVLTPPGGGPAQRLNRVGNRFAIDVDAPPACSGEGVRLLVAALILGMIEGVLLPFPQDITVGAPGAPVVDGAGQLGSTLNLRGFTPRYAARSGQFFSVIQGGRRYLHMIAAQAIADASGKVAAPIAPMLRVSPDDGAVCEFGQPMIEGFLSGNSMEWQVRPERYAQISFTVTEAA